MRKRWLQILALLVLALGILPILPAAAQSSCTVSTRATVRLRAGHSTNDTIVGTMPRNTQLQVVERFVEALPRNRTRVWYRLVKEQAAPTATSEQVWVGGTVRTAGDCVNIASTSSGANAGAPNSVAGAVLPQSGTWRWTLGKNVNVSCDGIGTADFSAEDMFGTSGFDINVASSGSGFSVRGITYTSDPNGTWSGQYSIPDVQGSGTAYIRVDTPTSMLGDLVITLAEFPGCSFKVPFWGSAR